MRKKNLQPPTAKSCSEAGKLQPAILMCFSLPSHPLPPRGHVPVPSTDLGMCPPSFPGAGEVVSLLGHHPRTPRAPQVTGSGLSLTVGLVEGDFCTGPLHESQNIFGCHWVSSICWVFYSCPSQGLWEGSEAASHSSQSTGTTPTQGFPELQPRAVPK